MNRGYAGHFYSKSDWRPNSIANDSVNWTEIVQHVQSGAAKASPTLVQIHRTSKSGRKCIFGREDPIATYLNMDPGHMRDLCAKHIRPFQGRLTMELTGLESADVVV
jgi:hypothetical protein